MFVYSHFLWVSALLCEHSLNFAVTQQLTVDVLEQSLNKFLKLGCKLNARC